MRRWSLEMIDLSVERNLNHRSPEVITYGASKWHVALLIYKAPSFRGIWGQIPQSKDIFGSHPKSHVKLLYCLTEKAGRFHIAPSYLRMEYSHYSPYFV